MWMYLIGCGKGETDWCLNCNVSFHPVVLSVLDSVSRADTCVTHMC